MIELEYSLIIEATEEPDYFGFYSPDLAGFSGLGHSIEDCLYKAKWGMLEHINLINLINYPAASSGVLRFLSEHFTPQAAGNSTRSVD